MSAFDPQAFLDAQQTEVNERRPPLPEGTYTAVIGLPVPKTGTITKGDKAGDPWLQMAVPLEVQIPPELRGTTYGETFKLTDGVFIDMLPGGKGIDNAPGRNRQQKAYREATGLNVAGQPFAWRMVEGKVVKIVIKHELYQEQIQERISAIMPA